MAFYQRFCNMVVKVNQIYSQNMIVRACGSWNYMINLDRFSITYLFKVKSFRHKVVHNIYAKILIIFNLHEMNLQKVKKNRSYRNLTSHTHPNTYNTLTHTQHAHTQRTQKLLWQNVSFGVIINVFLLFIKVFFKQSKIFYQLNEMK